MNIKIIDSWLREYLETEAKPSDIAKQLSLTSVSVEKTETIGNEIVYDIEVTTNRPDLMSVRGIAQEAAAVLPEEGIKAKYIGKTAPSVNQPDISFPIEIVNDPALVNRIMAVVMEVEIGPSPKEISTRLEQSGIRSLNNLIDVTNYVMREIGHPCHVFDYDLLNTKKMIIRKSKEGEELTTLDGKKYRLSGGDIVADNGRGEIIDLLGVMGTANSVVQDNTKRILFFLDNNNSRLIRQTSMNLGIRTEAAIINEKGIDPELMEQAFRRGVELYKQIAKGKVVTKTLDIYPNKSKPQNIKVNIEKINNLIGVEIPPAKSEEILKKLGFGVKKTGNVLDVEVPTVRADEVLIPEDIIEEIARVYGYHKLPSVIPGFLNNKTKSFGNEFYFEKRIKNALKYWGYTEVYTYSLVSEDMFQGPIETAVKLKNPLTNDMEYMRNSLIPSLLKVIEDNKSREVVRIFELANVYHKKSNDLPEEKLMLAGAVKKTNVSFYDVKGVIEQLLTDLGIKNYKFKERGEPGADIFIGSDKLGYIEILNSNIVDFELSFEIILKHATLKKVYKPLAKFPPVVEDITFVLGEGIKTEDVAEEIKLQSFLIREVTLKDQFENSKTFHIIYQAEDKNLTNTEVTEIRNSIIKAISEKFDATVK
jgi:phenylalanyl-tRNA synthetase beta chain